ncbi:hypothetical protein DMUE_4854 [Dictyocoela muelleri]|nr:hypothetical protein DMUE_4854 [Dictyocoela muelleri]
MCSSETPSNTQTYPLLTLPNFTKTNDHKKEMILKQLHYEMIHPGETKMIETLKRYLKIPGIKKIIKKVCQNCQECNQEKVSIKQYGHTKYTSITQEVEEMLGIDLKGPINPIHFKTSKKIRIPHLYFCRYL